MLRTLNKDRDEAVRIINLPSIADVMTEDKRASDERKASMNRLIAGLSGSDDTAWLIELFRAPLSMMDMSIFSIRMMTAMLESRHALAETAMALAAHHHDHKAYPESLGALVPGLLPAVPLDPFTGKPLVYRKTAEGYLLYSLGANMKDDGGEGAGEAGGEPDDIALRVN